MRAVLVLLTALVLASPALPASGSAKPRIWVASEHPAVIRGTGFHASERVAVTVFTSKQTLRRSVAAGALGGIVARFTASLEEGCIPMAVTAVGSRGSRATFKVTAKECPPPPPTG